MCKKNGSWARLFVFFSLTFFLPGGGIAYGGELKHNLGVVGKVYPIGEKDMEQLLSEKAKNVDTEWVKRQIEATVRKSLVADFPLPRAKEGRVRHIDPSIVVTEDIRDEKGRTLHAKGTTVNPLDHVALSKAYVIINGKDADQIEFTRNIKDPKMILLTEGEPVQLGKTLNENVYIATPPVLQRFEIGCVPAVVSQEGRLIRVEEIVLK